MLQDAGLGRNEIFCTNVIRVRPPGNEIGAFIAQRKADVTPQHGLIREKMVLPCVWEGIDLLKREIELCRPNVIIACGNTALWALCGREGISSWRGSLLQTDLDLNLDYRPKVIPTYHPSMIFRQYELRRVAVHDLKRAKKHSQSRELVRRDYSFVIRPTYEVALSVLQQLYAIVATAPTPIRLSVDIETRAGHIACVGIAWSRSDAICIPMMCSERQEGYWPFEEESFLGYLLYRLLTHPKVEVIGQNFLYDAQYFYRWEGYVPRVKRDTMIAQHSYFSCLPKSLDFLSSMYCEEHVYWKDDGKDWDAKTGEDQLWRYNCVDAVVTYEVDEEEQKTIASFLPSWPKLPAVHDFQQSLFYPVLKTMNRGIRVDTKRRAEFALTLMEEISAREAWLHSALGFQVNIKSPKQMQELFYDVLGEKPILDRKTGRITTNDEAIGRMASREPLLKPLVRKIQELRSLGVFLSTFVNARLDLDGRMRCSFNIAGTETYRFSSSANAFGSGLNLQNIPKGGGNDDLELPNVRDLFIPDPGFTFFDIDLSSADLRIVAWESDCKELKAMLRAGLDPYTEIAKEFYHDPTITKKDPRRQTFKSFAHGTHYLGTPKGLAERLGLSVHEADKTQKWYFGRCPEIKRWQDDLKDQVTKRRMVENVFGYRFYFFGRIEGNTFNEAAAWIPQSTVGCLINRGYVAVDRDLPEVQVLLQVHDSLAGQFPTHLGDSVVRRIVDACEVELPYDDPLTIPVGVKTSTKSWGACG